MKKFESFNELLDSIGVTFSSHRRYADEKLGDFLACVGSDEGKEPRSYFTIEIDEKKIDIGVTHEEVGEEEYKYTYWIF